MVCVISACDDAAVSIDDNNSSECCHFHIQEVGNAVFALSTANVEPEKPFSVLLTLNNGVSPISAKMTGVTMYMGTIPVMFKPVADGQWQVDIMVGSCSEPSMVWALTVKLNDNDRQIDISYLITVTHP